MADLVKAEELYTKFKASDPRGVKDARTGLAEAIKPYSEYSRLVKCAIEEWWKEIEVLHQKSLSKSEGENHNTIRPRPVNLGLQSAVILASKCAQDHAQYDVQQETSALDVIYNELLDNFKAAVEQCKNFIPGRRRR